MERKPIELQEQIDKRVAEYVKEFEKKHTAWVVLNNGNTYVGCDVYDRVTEIIISNLRQLVQLMGIEYSIKYPFADDKGYYLVIEGEDKARADFINKFIDNGYKLNWE